MADGNLDEYLEHLGISVEDENVRSLPDDGEAGMEEEVAAPPRTLLPVGTEARERCESFLVNVLLNFDPSYAVEISETGEGELHADIFGGDSAKMIGRNGRTLAALEYLTNAIMNRDEAAGHVRVNIDAGGYKRRRDERLRGVALKAAARVRKTGFAVELEPMSAAERRVIHLTLADEPEVMSESTGEGRSRRVVVKPG